MNKILINEILVVASMVLLPLTAIYLFFFMAHKYAAFRKACICISKYLFFISSLITFILMIHQSFYGKSSSPYFEISKIYFVSLTPFSALIWGWSSIIDQDKKGEKS